VKLIKLRIKLGTETPPPPAIRPPSSPPVLPSSKGTSVKAFLQNLFFVQIKRAVTLGVGALVGAGYLTVSEGDAYGATLSAVVAQIALSVLYAAYDKFIKPHVFKLLGAALTDAAAE
jgi:hypothetical protein